MLRDRKSERRLPGVPRRLHSWRRVVAGLVTICTTVVLIAAPASAAEAPQQYFVRALDLAEEVRGVPADYVVQSVPRLTESGVTVAPYVVTDAKGVYEIIVFGDLIGSPPLLAMGYVDGDAVKTTLWTLAATRSDASIVHTATATTPVPRGPDGLMITGGDLICNGIVGAVTVTVPAACGPVFGACMVIVGAAMGVGGTAFCAGVQSGIAPTIGWYGLPRGAGAGTPTIDGPSSMMLAMVDYYGDPPCVTVQLAQRYCYIPEGTNAADTYLGRATFSVVGIIFWPDQGIGEPHTHTSQDTIIGGVWYQHSYSNLPPGSYQMAATTRCTQAFPNDGGQPLGGFMPGTGWGQQCFEGNVITRSQIVRP